MDNSVTLLFGSRDPTEFNYGSPLYYRRGGVRPKLDRFERGGGVRILNYECHKLMTPIIASIKYLIVVNFFDTCLLYSFKGDCPSLWRQV